jgi:beta-lactamase class A
MMQRSDNSAANVLVARFGFARLNDVWRRLDLTHTHLRRYFWHFSRVHENLTSAQDMGELLLSISRCANGIANKFASQASCRAMIDTLLGQEDRKKIAAGLPRGIPLANKTGELPGVRHDAGIIDPYGPRPYVLVVLERDLADQSAGVAGIRRISRIVYDAYGSHTAK